MQEEPTAFTPLASRFHSPGLTGRGREGFLCPMTELRKQMEEGISAEEILEALRHIVIEKVVENRARAVERQHYGYPEPERTTTKELADFAAALVKAITR